jgi:PAS domain S-box-containing protein
VTHGSPLTGPDLAVLRDLFDALEQGVFACCQDGRCAYANPWLCAMLGRSQGEVVGRPLEEVFAPERAQRDCADLVRVLAGQRVEEEARWAPGGRERAFRMVKLPWREGRGVVSAMLVVLRERGEPLAPGADRLQALGRLAGGIVHDFHNALTLLAGQVGLLQRDLGKAGPHAAVLAGMNQALENAARLPRQLLAYLSEGESTRLPVDVDSLVCSLGGLLRTSLEGRVALEVDPAASPWRVPGDPAQLAQALLDLCSHALGLVGAGGRLVVRTERVLLSASDAVGHPEARPGRYVRLSVREEGARVGPQTGICERPLTGLAGAAERRRPPVPSAVGEVVRRHRGWLEGEGVTGKASYSLFLPADAGSEVEVELEESAAPRALRRVLVVDSDPFVREWNGRALQTAGFQPVLAARLAVAVQQCRAGGPAVDLVLLEQNLLRQAPQELVDELSGLARCPWVVVTAGEGLEALPAQVAARVHGVLPKPYGLTELLRAVRTGTRTGMFG